MIDTELNLEDIGIRRKIKLKDIYSIDLSKDLIFENIFGDIIDFNKKNRCKIVLNNTIMSGGYGIVHFGKRYDIHGSTSTSTSVNDIVVKKLSIHKPYNLLIEALLQYYSYKVLEKYNIQYMIPKVYDIYNKIDDSINTSPRYVIHFCMEEIKGIFIDDFLKESHTPEKDFLIAFIQICIVLNILEKELVFNHRDLRYTNIYVVNKKTEIQFTLKERTYKIISGFCICILDFGFACIGTNESILNAANGIIQNEEKCMKPGRDLFQLLISIWCKKNIRNKMKPFFIEEINNLLKTNKKDYTHLIFSKPEDSKWPYTLTRGESFNFVELSPENLFETLYNIWVKHNTNL